MTNSTNAQIATDKGSDTITMQNTITGPAARIMLDAEGSTTHGITASFELLTPEDAFTILTSSETMFKNRPIRQTVVNIYAEAMRQGEWKLAPEPLVITEAGELIQGQHRLNAVVMSETNQWFMVVRGWRTDVFDVLDSGVKRTVSDVLAINGAGGHNGGRMGAVSKLLTALDYADETEASPHNCTKKMRDRNRIILFAEKHTEALNWAYEVSNPVYISRVLTVPPSGLMAAAYIIANHGNDREVVEEFFKGMIDLSDAADPRWTLLRWSRGGKAKSGFNEMGAAVVVKAWNSWVKGVKAQQFAWRTDEPFPTPLLFVKGA